MAEKLDNVSKEVAWCGGSLEDLWRIKNQLKRLSDTARDQTSNTAQSSAEKENISSRNIRKRL